jgi:type II secretory pathway pseudopilin PulG
MEMIVIVALIILFSVVFYPNLQGQIDKARILGFVQSVSSQIQKARQEAIRMNSSAVVQPDKTASEILIFMNVDGDPVFTFAPDPTVTHRTADFEVSRIRLPVEFDIHFWSAGDRDPNGKQSVVGLTDTVAEDNAVVYLANGSVEDIGALRFGDKRGNLFEVRIGPQASGKIEVLKWNREPPRGGKGAYLPRGRDESAQAPLWVWY